MSTSNSKTTSECPAGITAYGTYVPRGRLDRRSVVGLLGTGGGRGTRSVASYDEDTTTLGVEAARRALAGAENIGVATLVFATAEPAYLDKTDATTVHAALGLPPDVAAYDVAGGARGGPGALRLALDAATRAPALAVLAGMRTGLPGGADEREGGDAAAAFILSSGPAVIAALAGWASVSLELLERRRLPGEPASQVWEERFAEGPYAEAGRQATAAALQAAGVSLADVGTCVVAGPHGRAVAQVSKALAEAGAMVADSLAETVGNTGAAHVGLLLAEALDKAGPGDVVCTVHVGEGADAAVWRVTEAIEAFRARRPHWGDGSTVTVPYPAFLTWRGHLHREPPRRPEPDVPAAPPSWRAGGWKFGFAASRCECGTRHLPPQRVCLDCRAVDRMKPERVADVRGTIRTFTVDRLAFSPSPPVVVAVVDLDGGGRFQGELTDVDPADVHVGDRVEMTFRRLGTAGGIHNYFWKARPVREAG